ncbi:uncharacterized protein B0H18DRAFT_1050735 [Fomitopsis serialis]|uniref:uncharacterized protein n=1 Tax=Fomitopsis serialis TaxID=139415 RepID=UPI002007A7AD|nr:uncharacterized protein B0H18DRAFT_1050735 [Neoantrodia serialis]KAH9913109.1 hypothetical protein B0H18DRAFT_1050735 [Neoantrodia serialis]
MKLTSTVTLLACLLLEVASAMPAIQAENEIVNVRHDGMIHLTDYLKRGGPIYWLDSDEEATNAKDAANDVI